MVDIPYLIVSLPFTSHPIHIEYSDTESDLIKALV